MLHHISNPDCQKSILPESLPVEEVGRGQITVLTEEQETPEKTQAKLTLIGKDATKGDLNAAESANGERKVGGDYFVPWHLPLHRGNKLQFA